MVILPKFVFVCGVKLKPFVTSHAFVVFAPLPVGTPGTITLHVVSSVRFRSGVAANAWLNRSKNPNRTWSFWSCRVAKFLKIVRSVFVRRGERMLYFDTR